MRDTPFPKDAPPADPARPYRVTAYRMVRARITRCVVVGDYRWYWQANAVSWFYHHVGGLSCNTWKAEP